MFQEESVCATHRKIVHNREHLGWLNCCFVDSLIRLGRLKGERLKRFEVGSFAVSEILALQAFGYLGQ